jgi:hypothetical protein
MNRHYLPSKAHQTQLYTLNPVEPSDPSQLQPEFCRMGDVEPAPLQILLGSQAMEGTITTLRKRIASFEAQTDLAASTDFPPGA